MKLINPTLTIQNAEGEHWLCTVDHADEGNTERIMVSMRVRRDPALTPAEIYELVMLQARERMGKLVWHSATPVSKRKPSPPGS